MPTKRGPLVGEAVLPAETAIAKKIRGGGGDATAANICHYPDPGVEANDFSVRNSRSSSKGEGAADENNTGIERQKENALGSAECKELANGAMARGSANESNEHDERMTENRDESDCSSTDRSSEDEESSDDKEEQEDEAGQKNSNDSTAFGRAFQKIMRKKLPVSVLNDSMGPILSGHKQLVAKKLDEADEGRKKRGEKRKEKQALREKGHIVPASYVVAKERELIKLATRGVVKLFNAVSKAQSIEAGAKITKTKEAKALARKSKSAFLSTLQGANGSSVEEKKQPLDVQKETIAGHKPGWSALQDTFMLGKSRLKDWDKKQDDETGLNETRDSSDDSESK